MSFDARLLSGVGLLLTVAETGSFARAAEAMGMTPSGVSRAIARLEGRLGLRLFDRNPRATTLTAAGQRLVADMAPLVGAMEEAARAASGEAQAVQGRLRVNCDPWFASLILMPRLQRFIDAYPAVSLDIAVRDRMGDLVSEGFDAAVRFGEPEPPGLITRRLLETRIVTCAAPAYIARHGRPQHPRALADPHHECILFRDPATGRPFEWEFHRSGEILPVRVHGRLILDEASTAVAACLAGLGIAQPMALGLTRYFESGELVDLFPEWAEEYFPLRIYHPSRHLPPAKVRAFLDFVAAIAREAMAQPGIAGRVAR